MIRNALRLGTTSAQTGRAKTRPGRILVKEWRPDKTLPEIAVDQVTGKSSVLIFGSMGVSNIQISRDDRWLLYESSVSGVPEIYVLAFGADSVARRVSTEPAVTPYWSLDGRRIVFKSMNAVKASSFRGDGNRPEIGVPQTLFTLPAPSDFCGIGPDGRFLVTRFVGPERPPGVRVVLNWLSEFGASAPNK